MNGAVEEQIFKPLTGDFFHFRCHRGVPCFNECCAKLRLILTPYDILRMKNRLKLSSDQFLEQYTDIILHDHHRFPMVKLKMRGNQKQTCPFVADEGCTIYQDRPEACRLYPVGRASARVDGEKGARERFFMVAESHCQGFKEKHSWTLHDWMDHEGVMEYSSMNDQWLGIITSSKSLGPEVHLPQKHRMFFMASYNLDKFREFLFKSGFFDRFEVDSDLKQELNSNDTTLMLFAFEWLKFSLFGEKSIQLKS